MPSIPRLHCASPLDAGGAAAGTPAQAHHLRAVLRRAPGDAVRLFNADDGEFAATIATLARQAVGFAVGPRVRMPTVEPGPALLFAPLKRDATDWLIEKATELGASRLLPVLTLRTQSERMNLDRLRAIATAAAEQSERLTIPAVVPPAPLAAVLDAWDPAMRLLVAAERSGAPLLAAGAGNALLVGPEGGFAAPELDALLRRPFVAPVSLGPRILRAETACLAGLAILGAAGPP